MNYSVNDGGRIRLAIQNTVYIFTYFHKYQIDLRAK